MNSRKVSYRGAQLGGSNSNFDPLFMLLLDQKYDLEFSVIILLKSLRGLGLGPVEVLKIFTGRKMVSPPALTAMLITGMSLNTVQGYGFCAKIRQFSVLCPRLCSWKFSSTKKMVFKFQFNARSSVSLSQFCM